MKTRRLATTAAAGTMVLSFALAGCSGSEQNEDQATQTEGQTSEASPAADSGGEESNEPTESAASESGSSGLPEDADLSSESPSLTPEDAIAAAEDEAKDGIVHAIELDFDRRDGAWQYEVKILAGTTDFDIEIDAETGEVVDVEKDSTDDKEEAIDLKDPMTFDKALELAQDKGSGRLESWKLESDDGRIEYQFDFDDQGQETEVSVDVDTERVSVDD